MHALRAVNWPPLLGVLSLVLLVLAIWADLRHAHTQVDVQMEALEALCAELNKIERTETKR